ncbi:MAG TPA: ribosomal-processing cysteine protease Prp [Ruminococcaceae bacterium]|nr:ribosomal-processing cysteine protease Prp [Oscillospiraceae bacterium]
MISVNFTVHNGLITGYKVSGHSGYSEAGSDIVCSAVSSAALMAANTVTEIQHIEAEVTVNDGFLNLNLSQKDAEASRITLEGLRLHLTALSQEYPQFIKVKISEV